MMPACTPALPTVRMVVGGPGNAVARELAMMAGSGIDRAPPAEVYFGNARDWEKAGHVAHFESADARGLARPTYFESSRAEEGGACSDVADDLGMATAGSLGIVYGSVMRGQTVHSGTVVAAETEMPVHYGTGRQRRTVVCFGIEADPETVMAHWSGWNAGETEMMVHRRDGRNAACRVPANSIPELGRISAAMENRVSAPVASMENCGLAQQRIAVVDRVAVNSASRCMSIWRWCRRRLGQGRGRRKPLAGYEYFYLVAGSASGGAEEMGDSMGLLGCARQIWR